MERGRRKGGNHSRRFCSTKSIVCDGLAQETLVLEAIVISASSVSGLCEPMWDGWVVY